MQVALVRLTVALRRTTAARRRYELQRARADQRDWQVTRRARTRQLIELGGLVAKAGVVELIDDDRAVLYGALLEVAAVLRSSRRDAVLALWRRQGKRAVEGEVESTP